MTRRILVIKLSALGDMVLSMPAFARLRAAEAGAHITLLTTPPYADLARRSPWFDAVETDGRPRSLTDWLALVRRLRRARFDRVYDLQANDRTNLLFQALRPHPPFWSGMAAGCAARGDRRRRATMHVLEREADQLNLAGVLPPVSTDPGKAPGPDLAWMLASLDGPRPAERLALLVPGASPRRPLKLWPAHSFATLALALQAEGLSVAIIGGDAERTLAAGIQTQAPATIDLTGRTDLFQLAELGARAVLAVGNATGPMHLIAAAGAPCLTLFSGDSDPARNAPRGRVRILQRQNLADLRSEVVLAEALDLWRQGDIAIRAS